MSNSSLVNYTKISPNKTVNRNHVIDTITIHCVVGQVSVERLGEIFSKPSRKASSNYGIGYDGKIGLYVEEKDRSWCSSSSSNDNRAVTIEVASDTTSPYAVTTSAYKSLIKLLADICKRNKIKELKWKADKKLIGKVDEQNMTVHRWFANKECPGKYLYDLHYQIAEEVNNLICNYSYKVCVGTFSDKKKANDYLTIIKTKGYEGYVTYRDGYIIQVGSFSKEKNAENLKNKLRISGFDSYIVKILVN